jgi:hypothetical protein
MLPQLDDLLARLPDLLRWIDVPAVLPAEARLASVAAPADEVPLAPAGIQYWGGGLPLEAIRFAGANRLLVEFDYHGKHRVVEPYSLRRARTTGNLLLYGWERAPASIKAFKVAEMHNVRASATSFQPRYRVEFTPRGSVVVAPTAAPLRSAYPRPRRSPARSGPTYVFECTYCRKRFRHAKNDPTLRKHKAKDLRRDCSGRHGYLVDTEWG